MFKAAKSAYIVLGSPYVLLLLLYGYVLFIQKEDVLDALGICIVLFIILSIIYIWLNGFRLTITDSTLSYRDGIYKTTVIQKSDIKTANHTWVEYSESRKSLKILTFLIVLKDSSKLRINVKPFSREVLKVLNNLIT